MEDFLHLVKIILFSLWGISLTTHWIAGCTLPSLSAAKKKFEANKNVYIEKIQPLDFLNLRQIEQKKRDVQYRLCAIEYGQYMPRFWHPWSGYKKLNLYLVETENKHDTYFYLGNAKFGQVNFENLSEFNRYKNVVSSELQFDNCLDLPD